VNAICIYIVDENGLGSTISRLIKQDILLNLGKAVLKFRHPDGAEETYTLYPGESLEEQVTHAKLNHYYGERNAN
jgi:hypothetical protein